MGCGEKAAKPGSEGRKAGSVASGKASQQAGKRQPSLVKDKVS